MTMLKATYNSSQSNIKRGGEVKVRFGLPINIVLNFFLLVIYLWLSKHYGHCTLEHGS